MKMRSARSHRHRPGGRPLSCSGQAGKLASQTRSDPAAAAVLLPPGNGANNRVALSVLSPLWRSGPNANLYWPSLVPRERPPTVHAPPGDQPQHASQVSDCGLCPCRVGHMALDQGRGRPCASGHRAIHARCSAAQRRTALAQHIGWVTHRAHSETRDREVFLSSSSWLAHDDTAPALEQCNTGVSSWGPSAGRQIPKPGTSERGGAQERQRRGQLQGLHG